MRNGKAECGTRKAEPGTWSEKSGLTQRRQVRLKESNNKGGERTEKQFLAILALPVRVCSQVDLERALASGREK